MKYILYAVFFALITACQTIKIKNEVYKITPSIVELGSVGESKSFFCLKNDFNTRSLPKLENKVRVQIEMIPFSKKLSNIYLTKMKYNQNMTNINYADSLKTKPEFLAIKIIDIIGFVDELNAPYNKDVYRIIDDLQNLTLISSIATYMKPEDIQKIKQADTYYLSNNQDKKYTIVLYKLGKKIDTIDINYGTILAYKTSNFCWGEGSKGQWYIADIINSNMNCKGKTRKKIKEKEKERSLFKM